MRRMTRCSIALAGLVAMPALACEQPSMVAVPDGQNAALDELLEAQENVKSYMAAMEEYLACIDDEIEAAGEDAPAQFRALMARRNNTAVDEMERVAAAFNEQIQAYREANPEESQGSGGQ